MLIPVFLIESVPGEPGFISSTALCRIFPGVEKFLKYLSPRSLVLEHFSNNFLHLMGSATAQIRD